MTGIVLTALTSAFFLVRILKGPWMRNPQYVAAACIGSVAISAILSSAEPAMAANFVIGGLAGLAGAWVGIFAFDLI